MTLPAPGNPISISQIDTEFALGKSLSSYRGVTWYTDGGSSGTFSSTNLGMDQFYSKRKTSPRTVSLASFYDLDAQANPGGTALAYYEFYSDGTATGFTNQGNTNLNWTTPTTTGIGSSYWIRFTLVSGAGGGSLVGGPTGSWLALSSTRSIGRSKTTNGAGIFTYTVDIASDSGGSTIVATKNILFNAEILI